MTPELLTKAYAIDPERTKALTMQRVCEKISVKDFEKAIEMIVKHK